MNGIRGTFVGCLLCFPVFGLFAGCSRSSEPPATLTLATTTSTRDSGLLDALLPVFEQQSNVQVKVVAVGSGQALELGRRGDADVLLTHAPDGESRLVVDGHAEGRQPVMHNDFVLLGPADNPAQVAKDRPVIGSFRKLAESKMQFVSRGDDSGTHRKERAIWKAAQLEPQGDWYLEAGVGMAEALRIADEKGAYILADRGTFLAHRERNDLVVLAEGDVLLKNPYSVLVVSAAKHPNVHRSAARQFARFLASPEARTIIREFGVEQFGQPLFHVTE